MANETEITTSNPDLALDIELDAAALEAALPTLTEKLGLLSADLSADERAVLSSIVTSAALHLEELQKVDAEGLYIFAKPISAAATPEIRMGLIGLPGELGFVEE
ncbi:hypothetical protein [Streptomyces griseorubiginosus]|uniref:hypothetical protein n=1 Tax=Streptomyces griseorubiginosus TaxID=67304 RepID=UPI002E80B685|nr:hypothetical protein [Streptomyces griseorubiginosus]WUB47846.1 hypothetical protein OHN19_32710 [Streptomyces griseorubiginosus]WUB56371.1 hypothetical protein OG942_32720 [Streptomyces griseorubiginosus]